MDWEERVVALESLPKLLAAASPAQEASFAAGLKQKIGPCLVIQASHKHARNFPCSAPTASLASCRNQVSLDIGRS